MVVINGPEGVVTVVERGIAHRGSRGEWLCLTAPGLWAMHRMMRSLRYMGVVVALGLACGEKDETTAAGSSETGGSSTTTGPEATTDGTTGTPTTSGGTTEVASTSSSTGGEESSTGEAPACETAAEDCGISVDGIGSMCVEPPPAKNELLLEVLGPGSFKFIEVGHDGACNVMIGSEVLIGPQKSIIVNYVIQGNPDLGCVCKFSVEATLSDVPAGTWTVYVGPFTEQVVVP